MGGNLFKDQEASPIKKEYISNTLKNYFIELKRVFPLKASAIDQFEIIGSAGKKDVSGDIDLAIDISKLVENPEVNLYIMEENKDLKQWNINKDEYITQFNLFEKRARTATKRNLKIKTLLFMISNHLNENSIIQTVPKKVQSGNIFTLFPQYNKQNKKTKKFVQIDWMIGKLDWLKFTYHSEVYKGNVKGLHRTQLMLAMFVNKELIFNHTEGVKTKDQIIKATTPKDALQLLNTEYKLDLDFEILSNYFKLEPYLHETLDKQEYLNIMKIYLKVLDRTRCDIPDNLQNLWEHYKEEIGLTGKFLPEHSKLKEKCLE